jgi:hypothetical protein
MSRVRTVILLLVVANLVFFGWAHWIDVPAQARTPLAAPVPALASAAAATRCKSLGPFVSSDAATHAAAALLARGIATQTRQASRMVPDGFLVYVNGFTSSAEEQKALQRLGRAGITDAVGVSEPGQEIRIIVGAMASEEQANDRVDLVQKSGFKAQTEARQRQESDSWIDARFGPQVPLPAVADLTSGPDAAAVAWGECVAAPVPHG